MSGGFGHPRALFSLGPAGNKFSVESSVETIPGSTKTLFTVIIGAGLTINLSQIFATTQQSGKLTVLHNGSLIGAGRSRPGKPDIFFPWFPFEPIAAGDTIKVEFEQTAGKPKFIIDTFLRGTQT